MFDGLWTLSGGLVHQKQEALRLNSTPVLLAISGFFGVLHGGAPAARSYWPAVVTSSAHLPPAGGRACNLPVCRCRTHRARQECLMQILLAPSYFFGQLEAVDWFLSFCDLCLFPGRSRTAKRAKFRISRDFENFAHETQQKCVGDSRTIPFSKEITDDFVCRKRSRTGVSQKNPVSRKSRFPKVVVAFHRGFRFEVLRGPESGSFEFICDVAPAPANRPSGCPPPPANGRTTKQPSGNNRIY